MRGHLVRRAVAQVVRQAEHACEVELPLVARCGFLGIFEADVLVREAGLLLPGWRSISSRTSSTSRSAVPRRLRQPGRAARRQAGEAVAVAEARARAARARPPQRRDRRRVRPHAAHGEALRAGGLPQAGRPHRPRCRPACAGAGAAAGLIVGEDLAAISHSVRGMAYNGAFGRRGHG